MKGLLLVIVAALGLVAPAGASSIFLDNGGTITLGVGDVVDNVVLIEAAHVEVGLGATVGRVILLDQATADILGGTISTSISAFGDAVIDLFVLPGTALLDGLPSPGVIDALNCPACAIAGTLSQGSLLSVQGAVLQNGVINVTPIPEPMSASLMALGLLGLAAGGFKRC